MAKKPNFSELKKLFEANKDFELTDAQYEKKTGAPLPKNKYYTITNSALAKLAKIHGYSIEFVEKRVILKRK